MARRWRKRKVKLGQQQVCSLCKASLDPAEPLQFCGGCQAVFHRACVEEFSKVCPTPGCGRPLTQEATPPSLDLRTKGEPVDAPSPGGSWPFFLAALGVVGLQFLAIPWLVSSAAIMPVLLVGQIVAGLLFAFGLFRRG